MFSLMLFQGEKVWSALLLLLFRLLCSSENQCPWGYAALAQVCQAWAHVTLSIYMGK